MLASLHKLKGLPSDTRVYCTHEYTLANINFALTVDPNNFELIQYYNAVTKLRESGELTLPSSIGHEINVNPFLRCDQAAIKESAEEYSQQNLKNELEVFTIIRQWKDNF